MHSILRFSAVSISLGLGAAALANSTPDVIGSWRLVSHTVTMNGTQMDSHAALLEQRPCASKIRYNVNEDGTYRLDASASDCDAQYKDAQQKLYAKTKWKVEGNKITTSATNFAVGQTYTVTVAAGRMTWVGTEGQGTLVFEK